MLNSGMREKSASEIKLPGKTVNELTAFWNSLQLCTMEPLTKESAVFLCRWALSSVCIGKKVDKKKRNPSFDDSVTNGLEARLPSI